MTPTAKTAVGATERLQLAHSPCPNDTFIFHAWTQGLLPDTLPVSLTFADIDITNNACAKGEFDIAKVSYAALPFLGPQWRLLTTGGALGRGCGPLILHGNNPSTTKRMRNGTARLAVPSVRSTAYLLLRAWAEAENLHFGKIDVIPFDDIMPLVADGTFDLGLCIHEARFTYAQHGLQCLNDLGQWWEESTGMPIPLGAIVAKEHLDHVHLTDTIKRSLSYAWDNPRASADYIAAHAQEMDAAVTAQHIELYVNEFSMDIGENGLEAVSRLLDTGHHLGFLPENSVIMPA